MSLTFPYPASSGSTYQSGSSSVYTYNGSYWTIDKSNQSTSGTSGTSGMNGTSGTSGSNGSSGTSGTIAVPTWTSVGAISISGTTTAPTKGTRTVDNISYRQLGSKEWEVVMTYYQTANTGAANGSGDYLFTLPNSLSFDTTLSSQVQYQSNIATNSWYLATYILPFGNGIISNGSTGGRLYPIIYNSTQFRLLAINDSQWVKCFGSGLFQMGDNSYLTIQLTFRFTST